jgi:hypothetical protein
MPNEMDLILPNMSTEQKCILDCLRNTNVITSSVAGSGKTTLALHVVRTYNTSRFLIVTYNRSLSQDCNDKIAKLKLTDKVKCFTYHALMGSVCNKPCYNDTMFLELLNTDICALTEIHFDFDAIIVDEMQDQRLHHYVFLCRLMQQLGKTSCRFLFIGDSKQLLYNFYKENPADRRYLELADQLFSHFTDSAFCRIPLSISFRTTPRIAAFVNHVCGGYMKSGNLTNQNKKVQFVISNLYNYRTVDYIYDVIKKQGHDNVMLLSNTVSKSNSMKYIINALRDKGITFFVSRNDYKQDSNLLLRKNKVVVETYCGVKGLERKCIFVFGLGYTKFRYNDKQNQLYVALTRSSGGELHIMHNYNYDADWLKGIDSDCLNIVQFREIKTSNRQITKPLIRKFDVHTILDFVDTKSLNCALTYFQIEEITAAHKSDFQSLVRFGGHFEDVRVIVSTALPMIMEFEFTGKCKKLEWLLKPVLARDQNELDILYQTYGDSVVLSSIYTKNFPPDKVENIRKLYMSITKTMGDWMEMSNAVLSYQNYSHLLSQIKHYDWFNHVDVDNLRQVVSLAAPEIWNEPCLYFGEKFTMKGQIDMITTTGIVFNFELTPELTTQQVLKAGLRLVSSGREVAYLYNMETKQLVKITQQSNQQSQSITDFIVSCKHNPDDLELVNDDQFVQKCLDSIINSTTKSHSYKPHNSQ